MKSLRIKENFLLIVITLALSLFVRAYVAQAYNIPSESMSNTLLAGDHVFVSKITTKLTPPNRGDIIVFNSPVNEMVMIKRVIGFGGETLEMRDKKVYINGGLIDEPYAVYDHGYLSNRNGWFGPVVIPENHVFVMGDNRDNSADSRYWGPLEISRIEGKAYVVHWSYDKDGGSVRWDRLGTLLKYKYER